MFSHLGFRAFFVGGDSDERHTKNGLSGPWELEITAERKYGRMIIRVRSRKPES